MVRHLTKAELEAGLDMIRSAPRNEGVLELIVRRPAIEVREVLEARSCIPRRAWLATPGARAAARRTADGTRHPDMQLNIMSARAVALVAQIARPLGAGRRSAVHRHGFERAQPAAGTRLSLGIRGDRDHAAAAHRLRQVRVALRRRGDEIRQLRRRPRAQPARRQRTGRAARQDSRGGRRPQAASHSRTERVTAVTAPFRHRCRIPRISDRAGHDGGVSRRRPPPTPPSSNRSSSTRRAPTPQCHASTIVETPSGLVASWFGGEHERHPDVRIWTSRYASPARGPRRSRSPMACSRTARSIRPGTRCCSSRAAAR